MIDTILEKRFLYPDDSWTPLEAPANPERLYASLGRLPTLQDAEDLLIQEALRRTGGNQTLSAKLLGTTRQKVSRWLHNHTSLSKRYGRESGISSQ